MKKFLIIILICLLIPVVFAQQQSLGTFKQNSCINLKQTCSNCTYNNISSVIYPNASQALGQSEMTKTGTEYNYTFCSTSFLGTYIVSGFGDLDGVVSVWSYDFDVTPNGETGNLGLYIMLTIVIIGTLLFGVFTRNIPITMLGGLFCMAFGLYTILNGFDSFRNLGTQIFSMALISGGAYWGIRAGLESIDVI